MKENGADDRGIVGNKTASISVSSVSSVSKAKLCYVCRICQGEIEGVDPVLMRQSPIICEECARRIKKMIYPEGK